MINTKEPSESKYTPARSLRELIAQPKGNLSYQKCEYFMLHVFWEVPNIDAAKQLLAGLNQCAAATHRDTPCVVTYFFRISNNDTEICVKSVTVGEHPQILAARKKIQRGANLQAVHAELRKRDIDPVLLEADDSTVLPESLQQHPIAVEFTEVYLDERAFMEHAGSRDYLDGYAVVTNPAMHNKTPITLRLGTPPNRLIETILEPVLKEDVRTMPEKALLWNKPTTSTTATDIITSQFWALDFATLGRSLEEVLATVPDSMKAKATTTAMFFHPHRDDIVRVMMVLPQIPCAETIQMLTTASPVRGEVHIMRGMEVDESPMVEDLRGVLHSFGLDVVLVNSSLCVGYVLHEKAMELSQIE
mmetsp:Transcript_12331/g.16945  ORF Transcript_12331/g.16945 Transcript_12331/m.16945 type:complete len:361 (+) Transcript_12331:16-1098(+)